MRLRSAGVKRRLQRAGDRCGDLALDGEDVGGGELAVVALRPEVGVGARVDELHVDAHAVARSLHAAFEDLRDAELIGDRLHRQLRVAELLDGGARDHPERADLRELGEDVVVDAVDEVGVVLLASLRFSKGSTAMEGRASETAGDAAGCAALAVAAASCLGFAGALVVPERPAAEQQEQREDRELGGADALLAAVAVVPGEDQDDRAGRSGVRGSRAAGSGAASRRCR